MDKVIGITGIISGLMCALADTPLSYFFDEKNQKIGQRRDIQTGWQTASSKRFYLSFLLSFLGQPGCYIVMWRLAEMIGKGNETMCSILKRCTFLGCYTGLITHAVFCIKPLVYKHICQEASLQSSENALHETDRLTILPVLVCSILQKANQMVRRNSAKPHLFSAKRNGTLICSEQSQYRFHGRCFSRAVDTDETDNLIFRYGEADIIQYLLAPESFGYMRNFKYIHTLFVSGSARNKIENRSDQISTEQQNDNPEQSCSVFVFFVCQKMYKSSDQKNQFNNYKRDHNRKIRSQSTGFTCRYYAVHDIIAPHFNLIF